MSKSKSDSADKVRIVSAMSGGVDSSVSTALLVEAGFDVIGVTMRLGSLDKMDVETDKPNCISPDVIDDARRVAMKLGIPFYAVNYEEQFRQNVIDYFVKEYLSGRTPNPCVVCNREVKFGKLLSLAANLEADYIATGHYARIEQNPDTGRYILKKGVDSRKDQSYFLFALTQKQLSQSRMPLGGYTKNQVREIARKYKLRSAEKMESQELCFIEDGNYRRFLKDCATDNIQDGDIVDEDGKVLGKHHGVPFYTVGQRRGLGVATGTPIYVTEVNVTDNTIIVGEAASLLRDGLQVERMNLIGVETLTAPINAQVKIRSKDEGAAAKITPLSETEAEVKFYQPRRAVTPGQAAVFYDGDIVIGGGWIK